MISKIVNKLTREGENPRSPRVRSAVGRFSGITGIICNVALAAGKLAVGALAGSVSVMADAFNNLSDAASAVVTLIGFKLAELPADKNHPFGHERFEYLTGLAVSVMILVVGVELTQSAVKKILHPEPVTVSLVMVAVLLGSIAIKLWLAHLNGSLGKLIGSSALEAAAADSRNDVISTAAVLAAAGIEAVTSWKIDGFMGLAVALFILWSGWGLAKETISPLLGEAADPALQEKITTCIRSDPHVLGYHDLMVHDYGPGQRFASIHVEMDKDEDPLAAHERIDALERACFESHGVHLVIHHDPVVTNDPELNRLRKLVAAILQVRDSRITIHDFRMVPGQQDTNLIFDIVLPLELRGQEESIRQALEAALNDLGKTTYHLVLTFDLAAFN